MNNWPPLFWVPIHTDSSNRSYTYSMVGINEFCTTLFMRKNTAVSDWRSIQLSRDVAFDLGSGAGCKSEVACILRSPNLNSFEAIFNAHLIDAKQTTKNEPYEVCSQSTPDR